MPEKIRASLQRESHWLVAADGGIFLFRDAAERQLVFNLAFNAATKGLMATADAISAEGQQT